MADRLLTNVVVTAPSIEQAFPGRSLPLSRAKFAAPTLRLAGWFTAALAIGAAVLPRTLSFAVTGLFCLAIVDLTMSRMTLRSGVAAGAARLLSAGSLIYAGGVLFASVSVAGWLMPLGTLGVLLGLALACGKPAGGWNGPERQVLAGLMFAGVALDGAMTLANLAPLSAWAMYLGPAEALRFRLLALARVAAMTLPALALLHQQAVRRRVLAAPGTCWSGLGLHAGAVLMPSVLALAALLDAAWKYLLPVPALMIFLGACSATRLARRPGSRLEYSAWVLIAGSMGLGLLMGLYAFDGPLPAPDFLGAYGAAVRSFVRQAHGFAIVAGILLVFLARRRQTHFPGGHS